MDILQALSESKNEPIIKKEKPKQNNKEEEISPKDPEKKKNTIVGSVNVIEQLSIISKESSKDSFEENDERKLLEISYVEAEKLEKKEKNVSVVEKLIKKCDDDIINLNKIVKKYQNSTKDLMMKSEIINDTKMVFIKRKEDDNDDDDQTLEKKTEYFKEIKNDFEALKRKLESLLTMYNSEKILTEKKKDELENLEILKKEYNEIKEKEKKGKKKKKND